MAYQARRRTSWFVGGVDKVVWAPVGWHGTRACLYFSLPAAHKAAKARGWWLEIDSWNIDDTQAAAILTLSKFSPCKD